MDGIPWLGVEVIESPSLVTLSQAQPDPNLVAAASLNFARMAWTDPQVVSMASFSAPVGPVLEVPTGPIHFQNIEWL